MRLEGVATTSHHFIDDIPDMMTQDKLPALIWSFADTYNEALRAVGFAGVAGLMNVALELKLLLDYIDPAQADPQRLRDLWTIYVSGSATAGWLDRLVTMLKSREWRLNERLARDLMVERTDMAVVDWQGELFVGIQMRVILPVQV